MRVPGTIIFSVGLRCGLAGRGGGGRYCWVVRITLPRVLLAVVVVLAAILPAVRDAKPAQAQAPSVVINEFVAANSTGLTDNTGANEDWIELHNASASSVNLAGWTIADGDDSYTFGSVSIAGNGYRVVFASNDVSRSTASETHLPFKLSADGEPLTLRDAAGVVSDPAFAAPGFPGIPIDTSYGRTTNGDLGFFTSPTPGSANNTAAGGIVEPVSFSKRHGFYTSTQLIVLTTSTPGATIRYTLNGSAPTPTSGTVIAPGSALTVAATSTVRAIAYRSGWIPSNVETRSYFFANDIITQQQSTPSGWPNDGAVNGQAFEYGMDPNIVNGNESTIIASLTSIPSLSIVTDQANLTNTSTGIYVNANNAGRIWERPASVELIDPTGAEPGFEINAGVRIRGGGSRRDENPKHSLRLYFRDEYGDGQLEYPLFGADGVDQFDSVGLATGQNGSWSYRGDDDATWVRDPWARATQEAMGQPNTDSRYYHLYLNGQYWGLYYSQERLSGRHGVEHFGGRESDYDVVGGNWMSAATASDGTVDGLKTLYPLAQDLFVNDTEFATLEANVDLVNLADYFLLHFFSGDYDATPMGWTSGGSQWADSNNWRMFRNRTGAGDAGKWLFFDHDSEFTLCAMASNLNTDNTTPWNLDDGSVPNHQVPTPAWLHEALITHPAYQQIFRDRVVVHMQTAGGALTEAANQARFDAIEAALTGAIDAEAARWGDTLNEPPHDRADWNTNMAVMRQCATDRRIVVEAQLRSDGLWPDENPPMLSPSGGAVPYATRVTIDANGEPGTIWYTTDGTDPRDAAGEPGASAQIYSSPILITSETTIRARVREAETWTPLAEGVFTLSTPLGDVPLLLNEYNAVGGSKFLGGGAAGDTANGSDATFGRIAGNGGDWFELVALQDLDITGWTFEVWHLDNGLPERSAALTVTSAPELTSLRQGTIITVSEDIADDLSWNPAAGDWHINLQANSADAGAYFTTASQQNFAIDNDDTQIAIFDEKGAPVALRTGEGTVDGVSVNSEEVFKLEGEPSFDIPFDSVLYADGTTSTWGLPNMWGAGAITQDLSALRVIAGDVNCDTQITISDALVIAQYAVGTREPATRCPIEPTTEIFAPAADADGNGGVNIADALLVAQCTVGLTNSFCPD